MSKHVTNIFKVLGPILGILTKSFDGESQKRYRNLSTDEAPSNFIYKLYPKFANPKTSNKLSITNLLGGLFPVLNIWSWHKVFNSILIKAAANPVEVTKTTTRRYRDRRFSTGERLEFGTSKFISTHPDVPYRALTKDEGAYYDRNWRGLISAQTILFIVCACMYFFRGSEEAVYIYVAYVFGPLVGVFWSFIRSNLIALKIKEIERKAEPYSFRDDPNWKPLE